MSGDYCGSFIAFSPLIGHPLLKAHFMVGWGSIKVGIIDSGVSGIDCVEKLDFCGEGCEDVLGHGSTVAAIVKTIASGCQLYSLNIGARRPKEENALKALEWAIDNKMDIVNISSGFSRHRNPESKCALCELVNYAVGIGMIVVVAAGNNDVGPKIPTINCPGLAASAVTVSAVDAHKDEIASYSCVGKPGWTKPNILAPGFCFVGDSPISGTSFAAPVIAGVCAAILSTVKDPCKAVDYIYNTARNLSLPNHIQGHGLICIGALVEAIESEKANCKCSGQTYG